jgi:hypothetical protein
MFSSLFNLYRNSLFEKLQVKSMVGLALYAVKHGVVKLWYCKRTCDSLKGLRSSGPCLTFENFVANHVYD